MLPRSISLQLPLLYVKNHDFLKVCLEGRNDVVSVSVFFLTFLFEISHLKLCCEWLL